MEDQAASRITSRRTQLTVSTPTYCVKKVSTTDSQKSLKTLWIGADMRGVLSGKLNGGLPALDS
jgi:hypothetical protein